MVEEMVEVHLEELGQRSWLAAAANTLLGTSGSAQHRFVARPGDPRTPAGKDATGGQAAPRAVGDTFPMLRWQDLDDRSGPNAWLETAEERLESLDRELLSQGWSRRLQIGRHWWSRRYTRTTEEPQA